MPVDYRERGFPGEGIRVTPIAIISPHISPIIALPLIYMLYDLRGHTRVHEGGDAACSTHGTIVFGMVRPTKAAASNDGARNRPSTPAFS